VTRSPGRLGDERGIALVLGLLVLLTLSALALASLAVSALEPQIARNLHDASRARWLAEAGIELGYGLLAAADDGTWRALLATSTAEAPWVVLPSLDGAALPGLTPAEGTYTVSLRKDPRGVDGAIVRSAGTFNATTRTIEIIVRRTVTDSAPAPTTRALDTISGWREL
jgi:Tfp pilus assembly protein PilX